MKRACAAALFIVVMPCLDSGADPQHWGMGFSYLVTVERDGPKNRLVVYAPPLRAKDAVWIARWVDASDSFKDLVAGGLAVGDFWPANFGKEYLAALTKDSQGDVWIKLFEPPEVFSTKPWRLVVQFRFGKRNVIAATAGDLLGKGRDQLIVITKETSGYNAWFLVPPDRPGSGWSEARKATLPNLGKLTGAACGDFWGSKKDSLALAVENNMPLFLYPSAFEKYTQLHFYSYDGPAFKPIVRDLWMIAPTAPLFTGADFVKDGFDVLVTARDARFELRVAPRRLPTDPIDPGPLYTGRAPSGQWLPGSGYSINRLVMNGTRESAAPGSLVAVAAGRVFGYIRFPGVAHEDFGKHLESLRATAKIDAAPDAEIAFASRFPTKLIRGTPEQVAPNFGWPLKDEEIGYEIAIKNNGSTPIAAGARLRYWINTPYRNADTRSDLGYREQVLAEPIPPFDPLNPRYVTVRITTLWPYDLIPAAPGSTWKKINLEQVGERWMVAVLEAPGDANPRNNRYETALHAWTFHPVFNDHANPPTLADRATPIAGDPSSVEYLARKLADAIGCAYERAGTSKNEDVLIRTCFDGYHVGKKHPMWARLQPYYEGWRDLTQWWGNEGWHRLDWKHDGGGELHETGHLFVPLGDFYGYRVMPVFTGTATMSDGTPVQLATHIWGPGMHSDNSAVVHPAACDLVRKYLVGSRADLEVPAQAHDWHELAPEKVYVRVLDRAGRPVSGAQMNLWCLDRPGPAYTGSTDGEGRWEISQFRSNESWKDVWGRTHYKFWSEDPARNPLGHEGLIVTVAIGENYQDAGVLGMQDATAHTRVASMFHSFADETEWTWDLKTNYDAAAPAPGFGLISAVEASRVKLSVDRAKTLSKYRLYRIWEPANIRTLLGEWLAPAPRFDLPVQDLDAGDSHSGARRRAHYEVTEVALGRESLPRRVFVVAIRNGHGISADRDDRKLLVALNAGEANPFCALFDGTNAYREYFYHYSHGHRAMKAAPSRATPGKYYATLADSGTRSVDQGRETYPGYQFDLILPPRSGAGYDVRIETVLPARSKRAGGGGIAVTLQNPADAVKVNPGDMAYVKDVSVPALVRSVSGAVVTVAADIFKTEKLPRDFTVVRSAGRPGNNVAMRELNTPRGLATVALEGREYVVIADTGNGRVVVWDEWTRYVAHLDLPIGSAPAAVAPLPSEAGKFFAISRSTARQSKLHLMSLANGRLSIENSWPIDVGDHPSGREMGLAVCMGCSGGGPERVVLAVTDAGSKAIREYTLNLPLSATLPQPVVYTEVTGTYLGDRKLKAPTDVAYVGSPTGWRMYAVDGDDRVVRVK
jgi:hypothetical protein